LAEDEDPGSRGSRDNVLGARDSNFRRLLWSSRAAGL